MSIFTGILIGLVCFFIGAIAIYIFIKRFNKQQIEAATIIAVSEKEDEKRDEIVDEIQAQIEKNKEAMNEIEDILNNSD